MVGKAATARGDGFISKKGLHSHHHSGRRSCSPPQSRAGFPGNKLFAVRVLKYSGRIVRRWISSRNLHAIRRPTQATCHLNLNVHRRPQPLQSGRTNGLTELLCCDLVVWAAATVMLEAAPLTSRLLLSVVQVTLVVLALLACCHSYPTAGSPYQPFPSPKLLLHQPVPLSAKPLLPTDAAHATKKHIPDDDGMTLVKTPRPLETNSWPPTKLETAFSDCCISECTNRAHMELRWRHVLEFDTESRPLDIGPTRDLSRYSQLCSPTVGGRAHNFDRPDTVWYCLKDSHYTMLFFISSDISVVSYTDSIGECANPFGDTDHCTTGGGAYMFAKPNRSREARRCCVLEQWKSMLWNLESRNVLWLCDGRVWAQQMLHIQLTTGDSRSSVAPNCHANYAHQYSRLQYGLRAPLDLVCSDALCFVIDSDEYYTDCLRALPGLSGGGGRTPYVAYIRTRSSAMWSMFYNQLPRSTSYTPSNLRRFVYGFGKQPTSSQVPLTPSTPVSQNCQNSEPHVYKLHQGRCQPRLSLCRDVTAWKIRCEKSACLLTQRNLLLKRNLHATRGAAVVSSDYSPTIKANRVRFPVGSPPGFPTMPLITAGRYALCTFRCSSALSDRSIVLKASQSDSGMVKAGFFVPSKHIHAHMKRVPPQFTPGPANPQCSRVLRAPSQTVAFTRRVSRLLVHSHHEHLVRRRLVISRRCLSSSPMSLAAFVFAWIPC
ncbi:hypothetical protein PR048_012184 [Dryococelus australis]|uniref:Uncharacterized protein n=1 Tax=Dryococelus australis TaxID=614101 RepID=A0ABQ9HNQ8_9NEOP|nr:hypothetical protein PR048_012184 [Dryococelus australis]